MLLGFMLAIVLDEECPGDCEDVHVLSGRHHKLEPSRLRRVSGSEHAINVTFEEELDLEAVQDDWVRRSLCPVAALLPLGAAAAESLVSEQNPRKSWSMGRVKL